MLTVRRGRGDGDLAGYGRLDRGAPSWPGGADPPGGADAGRPRAAVPSLRYRRSGRDRRRRRPAAPRATPLTPTPKPTPDQKPQRLPGRRRPKKPPDGRSCLRRRARAHVDGDQRADLHQATPARTRTAGGQGPLTHWRGRCRAVLGHVPPVRPGRPDRSDADITVPARLMKAFAWQESGWQSTIIACDGGIGTMQCRCRARPDSRQQPLRHASYDVNTLSGNTSLGARVHRVADHVLRAVLLRPLRPDRHAPRSARGATMRLRDVVIAAYNVGPAALEDATARPPTVRHWLAFPNRATCNNVTALITNCVPRSGVVLTPVPSEREPAGCATAAAGRALRLPPPLTRHGHGAARPSAVRTRDGAILRTDHYAPALAARRPCSSAPRTGGAGSTAWPRGCWPSAASTSSSRAAAAPAARAAPSSRCGTSATTDWTQWTGCAASRGSPGGSARSARATSATPSGPSPTCRSWPRWPPSSPRRQFRDPTYAGDSFSLYTTLAWASLMPAQAGPWLANTVELLRGQPRLQRAPAPPAAGRGRPARHREPRSRSSGTGWPWPATRRATTATGPRCGHAPPAAARSPRRC